MSFSAGYAASGWGTESWKRQRVEPRMCDVNSEDYGGRWSRSAGKRIDPLSNGRVEKSATHMENVWPPTLVGKSVTHIDNVWPPTLVGKRKDQWFIDPYVHDSDATAELTLPKMTISGHANAVWMKQIRIESVKCDQCPVYVFPPSAEGFLRAMYVDHYSEVASFPNLSVGWTLKYATVEDMTVIDPHRKLVDWIPIHTSKEINDYNRPINMIATPQCLSTVQKQKFQAKLQILEAAQTRKETNKIDVIDLEDFESKLTSILFQDGLKSSIQEFLKMMTFRRSHMKKAFAFDGVRVANASFERLNAFGVLMGEEREHAANAFTSRLIHRGTEHELEILQTTTNKIRYATATKRQLTKLELDHLESARVLVEKQNKEMMQHLVEWVTKFQTLMEEDMMSGVELVTSLRQTEKEASLLQKFISSGATEIVEETYSDALKEKEQELIRKAKPIQECCICYNGLEGFSVATSEDGEKLHKRACFLPCMHANVCTTCSEKRWNEGPRECPICRQPLTKRPRVIYL